MEKDGKIYNLVVIAGEAFVCENTPGKDRNPFRNLMTKALFDSDNWGSFVSGRVIYPYFEDTGFDGMCYTYKMTPAEDTNHKKRHDKHTKMLRKWGKKSVKKASKKKSTKKPVEKPSGGGIFGGVAQPIGTGSHKSGLDPLIGT